MNCDQAQELLSEYIDGQLAPGQAEGLQAHVSSCERCARELAELGAVVAELRKLPLDPAPEGLCGSVMADVRRGPARHRLLPLAAALIAAAAGLVVVFTCALLPRRPVSPSRRLARALPRSKEGRAEPSQDQAEAVVAATPLETKKDAPAERVVAETDRLSAPTPGRVDAEMTAKVEVEAVPKARERKPQAAAFSLRAAPPAQQAEARAAPRPKGVGTVRLKMERHAAAAAPKSRLARDDKEQKRKQLDARTITVLTNDPPRARVHIAKLVSGLVLASSGREPTPGSGPVMVVLTQARYASLLKVLETSGYELERDAADRVGGGATRRRMGANAVDAQEPARRGEGAVEVTIRFRRVGDEAARQGQK